MNERLNFKAERVKSLAVTERSNRIIQRDLELVYAGKVYVLSVGTNEYLSALKHYNQNFPEEEKLDEKVLVLESVNNLEAVINTLVQMETNAVIPYLTEQVEDPTD